MNKSLFLFVFFITTFIEADLNNSLIEIYESFDNEDLIKIVVKDNIDIKDKVTSAGSLALSSNIAKKKCIYHRKVN